ncbi:hypothetical protein [Corynebacterium bouchesdurhonense]|uniref:hypothetical protein n=1 Tax=Corynebacterium bouchesdurhonense TaxID=1720192 RepID=UPI00083376E6|nr:hypothetical protein [Corynebacterium bouchesdurhonense]
MTKVPMVADGGELTTLRELASDVYGRERVDWPEQMPDEVKPKIEDGFEFGYLYRLNRGVGRMGRRWVRADASILAADFEDGRSTPIPDSGFSDFEAVLDEASARVSGEALFQKEITRSGLGPLVPFRDFNVGDVWPVLVWDLLVLDVVVSRIEATSEVGAATDWRVLMGNELVSDYAAQQRANESAARAVEQSRRQARSEARRQAEAVRSYADSAVAVERAERRDDVDSVRVVLGGARASEESLVSQLAAVQAQITGMVDDGEPPPAPGLLNSYLWLNTKLWEQQQDINRLNREFQAEVQARQREQAVLDARQDAQAQQIALAVPRVASIKEGENESAENDFFRLSISGRDPNVRDNWVFQVQLKQGWEGSMIVLVRSDAMPMRVYPLTVSRDGFVAGQSVLSAFAFSWPREGLSLVAIGVANPPV